MTAPGMWRTSLTRRSLAKHIGTALVAAAATRGGLAQVLNDEVAGATAATQPGIPPKHAPVVSFFLDQPYLDQSGWGEPYRPAAGVRGGQPLATLSEEDFRNVAPHW